MTILKRIATLTVAICLVAATATAQTAKPVTIRLFHHMSEQSKRDGLDKVIALFTKANPNIKVEVEATDFNSYGTTLKVKIAAGDAPDIMFGLPTVYSDLVKAGQVLDLTGSSFLANVSSSSLDSVKIGGKVYGLPLDVQTMGVFYNKALFAANGWKVPKTYPELITLAKAIKAKGLVPFSFGFKDAWTAQVLFASDLNGGALAKMPDLFSATLTRTKKFAAYPELSAAFDRYAERLGYGNEDPFSVSYSQQLDQFATGKTLMVAQGNWAVGDIRKANPTGQFGFFTNPSFAKEADNLLDISVDDCFMASAQTKNKDAVLKFLAVMVSAQGAATWAETAQVISVVKNVKLASVDPMLSDIQAILTSGKTFNFGPVYVLTGQYDKTFRQIQEEFAADSKRNTSAYISRLDAEFDKIKAME